MLLFTENAREELRLRGEQPEYSAAIARLSRKLDAESKSRVSVRTERAGYYHDYFCPDHAKQLEFDAESPETHKCPVDGRSFGGEKLDAAWLWFLNDRLSSIAFESAVLGVSTGQEDYLESSRFVLTEYARQYESYEPDPTFQFSGRACFHALDEAVWLIHLTWAYDLVWGNTPNRNAGYVRTRLLEPAADWIASRRRRRIHNIECWLNAAVVTAGAACGRVDLIEEGLEGAHGFREQIRRGVLGDGLWYEGSLSYHFYTLAALMWTSRACEAVKPDLARSPALERMLLAPIELSAADGSLPSNNDCWNPINLTGRCGHGIPEPSDFYETGWAWYRRTEFAAALQRARSHRPRDSVWVLLEGRRVLPESGASRVEPSVAFQDSGLAVLRGGSLRLILKYGRHGGVHGHYDKLGLSIYGEGRDLSADLGTPGFGVRLSDRWYTHTASHNTALVDGNRQPPGWGSLLKFETAGDFQLADSAVGWTKPPYKGVRFRRAVLLKPPYFIDLYSVAAPESRQFDWIYHNKGTLRVPGEPALEDGAAPHPDLTGWARIHGVRTVQWTDGYETGLTVFLGDADTGDLYSAEGPSNPASESRMAIVRRLRADRGLFVAVFCPWRRRCPVQGVQLESEEENRVGRLTVDVDGYRDVWDFGSFDGHAELEVSLNRK